MKLTKVIAVCLAGVLSLLSFSTQAYAKPVSELQEYEVYTAETSVTGSVDYTTAFEMLDILNKERTKAGVKPLKMDQNCLDLAMQRAAEISIIFSHTRPDGTSDNYGENILNGPYNDADYCITRWMNSPGHKENMLLADYEYCGIGNIKVNGCYYWVQVFGMEALGSGFEYVPATKSDYIGTKTYTIRFKKGTPDTVSVKFNSNGGTVDTTSLSVPYYASYGKLPTPIKTGYTFNGWYTKKSGGTAITSSSIMKKKKTHTLYAHWKANSYTVTYASQYPATNYTPSADTGLYVRTKTIKYNKKYSLLSAPKLSAENSKLYKFCGWYDSPTGGNKIKSSTKHLTDGNVTLYARWKTK